MSKPSPTQSPPYTAATTALFLLSFLLTPLPTTAYRPWPQNPQKNITDYSFGTSKKYEGSSEFVKLRYHMGPVLTNIITVHTICEKFCAGQCAYPFAVPQFMPNVKPFKSPNGDVGVDGMISVIGHEIAELASNPLANAWYAGGDPSFPVEIADLCEGIYGTGGGGSYTGQVLDGHDGATYNMNGIRRKFLVQWLWSHVLNYCTGPNALDH
ncbi:protein exordium-like 3 [Trifolium pratense]|uniref:Protein exordium-like 3 n=1 Tax=Trifolium pratense TaxID=57577 RepID=A0A2K3M1U7_TRIPR|nr:protein exordium-like 3 [Trifolium pratense]PNX84744.1 protein exordium-like 3 [Trifolium pratense]PNX85218.1 protein exordium-like 3 [Trifolium pratense]